MGQFVEELQNFLESGKFQSTECSERMDNAMHMYEEVDKETKEILPI